MKLKLYILMILAVTLGSCSSIKHTASYILVDTHVASLAVADIEVAPTQVSRTTSWGFNPFKRVSIEIVKDNTTAQILHDANADVLVEPEYIIEKRGFLRGGSVTVTGFPATYSNFHKMTPEEAEIFKAINSEQCKKKCKKSKLLIF